MISEIHVVTQNEAAGAQAVAWMLAEKNENAELVFLYNKSDAYKGPKIKNIEENKKVSFFSKIKVLFKFYLYLFHLKPDVIFLHTHNAILLGAFSKFFCKQAIVVHHGMPDKYNALTRGLIDFFTNLKFFNKIVCVSHSCANKLNYRKGIMSSVYVIYNNAGMSFLEEKLKTYDEFISQSDTVLFTTGRLHKKKNQIFLM